LVRYLAVELAPSGIRVNAVSGGVVETGALEHFPNKDEMLRAGRANPVGRLVAPGDIAGAVAFLCSPDAEMVRGQALVVDDGFWQRTPGSDWVGLAAADEELAAELLAEAIEANA